VRVTKTGPGPIRGFRAFYRSGDVPFTCPREFDALDDGFYGVVVYYDPPFRDIVIDGDWYVWKDGTIDRVTTHPEVGHWIDRPPRDVVAKRSGSHLPDDEWDALYGRIVGATEWP